MPKQVFIAPDKFSAVPHVGNYLIDWCVENPGCGLGGATGRSPIDVWSWVWTALGGERAADRSAVVNQEIVFLDEYFGAYPAYYHWAHRNLRVGRGGFEAKQVFTPRGCFFEQGRVVNASRLDELLADWPEEWTACGQGEDGTAPEIRIHDDASHPVLSEIRDVMAAYDRLVRDHDQRLQLLGLGVGGAIDSDPRAGGHIGFVEYGAAAGDTRTMLARLASSTESANESDFLLKNADGDVRLEKTNYAVTQGISTILSAGQLLLMAWGGSKAKAVERMFFGEPCPQNAAAWVQRHENVTVFLDEEALAEVGADQLAERGWNATRLQSSAAH